MTDTTKAAGHTPGPWMTWGDGIVRHKGSGGLLGVKIGSPWEEDAWCRDDADAETLANARLIVAAPALLEALIEMEREKSDYMTRNNLGDPAREHTNKMARAAIRLATLAGDDRAEQEGGA